MSVDATNTTFEHPPTDRPHERPTGSEDEEFGPDDVFHLLQNQRRRRVLRCLRGVEGTVSMSDLTEQVAAWEHGTTVEALTSTQRQRVYIALYQRHLPKLDDMDVLDYNQSRGFVTPRVRAERIVDYLDMATESGLVGAGGPSADTSEDAGGERTNGETDDTDARWRRYSLAFAIVGAAVLAMAALDVPLLASVSELGVAVVVVVGFVLLSVGRWCT
ncbi:DUF7344 domain-containing protein [Salinigranum marinum]|uniref:DUF7344 domain-containing protein n=1 Tax=Salinigranum marinum TaxID=1515595 RepID=UPI002989E0C6|nr:hypothetical protein [Salinigranum marinum]